MSIRKIIKPLLTRYYSFHVKMRAKSVGKGLKVNFRSAISRNTTLGNNVNMNGLIVRGKGELSIGDNFHSGPDILILTQNHNYQGDAIPYDNTYIKGKTTIEDNVWIGARVTILPNVRIGEGAIIQAGSVVVKDIPKFGIAGGSPAKVFKYRDQEHYLKLKNEGKFH